MISTQWKKTPLSRAVGTAMHMWRWMGQVATPYTSPELQLHPRISPSTGTMRTSTSPCTWILSLTPGTRTDQPAGSPFWALAPQLPRQPYRLSTNQLRATPSPPLDTRWLLGISLTCPIRRTQCTQAIPDTRCTRARLATPSWKIRRPILTIPNTGSTVYPQSLRSITPSTCRTAARASSTGRTDAFAPLLPRTRSTCRRRRWKRATFCRRLPTDRGTLWCSDPPVAQRREKEERKMNWEEQSFHFQAVLSDRASLSSLLDQSIAWF